MQIGTLPILNNTDDEENSNLTEDQVFTCWQAARHTCVALKRYFEAHLGIKSDQVRRSHTRTEGGYSLVESKAYKVHIIPS